MRLIHKLILPFIMTLALASPALSMTATQKVEREVTITQEDGTQVTKRERADLVTPGERIIYTLEYNNDKLEPASDLVLTMPVPAEITYIEGSATNERAIVTFSADGGENFKKREAVSVLVEDGKKRKALSSDITHIRWELQDSVEVGESGSLSFKGILK